MSGDKMREALQDIIDTGFVGGPQLKRALAALAEQPAPTRKPVLAVYGDKIREDFEAWISAPPFEKSIKRLPMDEKLTSWPGAYRPIEVELAWEAWQAALVEQPAQGEVVTWCSACKGSGESTGMAGSGPDAYEVPCPCPQCGGTGASPPAPSVPDDVFCRYCGGNDETPPDHCMDCQMPPPPAWREIVERLTNAKAAALEAAIRDARAMLAAAPEVKS